MREEIENQAARRIMSAPFSPIIMAVALVLPDTTVGMIDASITRSRSMPFTRSDVSTTAIGPGPKPAWEDQKSGPINPLEKKLGQRVPISHVYKTGFHFPYAFMTYGCAKWSVGSVLGFSKVISELLNVTDRFAAFNSNFELP
jgi:hypothetical protein